MMKTWSTDEKTCANLWMYVKHIYSSKAINSTNMQMTVNLFPNIHNWTAWNLIEILLSVISVKTWSYLGANSSTYFSYLNLLAVMRVLVNQIKLRRVAFLRFWMAENLNNLVLLLWPIIGIFWNYSCGKAGAVKCPDGWGPTSLPDFRRSIIHPGHFLQSSFFFHLLDNFGSE